VGILSKRLKHLTVVEYNNLQRHVRQLESELKRLKVQYADMNHQINIIGQTLLIHRGKTLGS